MVKFLVEKPVAVIMVFVALVLLGAIAVTHIPISPLPNIDIPEITVHVSKPNSSADELENTVVKNLRMQLVQVPGVDDVNSETRDSYAIIKLKFRYGSDINYSFLEVNERIDQSMNNLPRDLERPRVIKASATDIPVFYLNLTLKNPRDSGSSSSEFIALSDFASKVIKRRFEQLPEVAFVDVTGVSFPEVYIQPDPGAMASLDLKDEDFRKIIESNDMLYANISASNGALQYNVRFASDSPVSIDDIRHIRFKHKAHIFTIGQIATVGIREKDPKGSFIANNRQAVNLAIIKQPDSKMDDLRKQVQVLLAGFQKDYPDIKFEQSQDQTELLEFSISSLKQDLLSGGCLAFILMFFFLKNLRAPLLIAITIPVCLVLSILFLHLLHLSINIISLSGLVLGVGLMIDNSIIVIDNITHHYEKPTELIEACVKGTSEIIRPLLSSVLTTCSVFLPLIFVSGISGALFFDQAMAITIGLSVSFCVSVTLLPTLFSLFYKKRMRTVEFDFFEKYGITFFERAYESGFHWIFKNKFISFTAVIVLILSNFILFNFLDKERVPVFKQTELVTKLDWNENISVSENQKRVLALVRSLPNVAEYSAKVGEQQYLLNKERELSSSETEIYVRAIDGEYLPGITKQIKSFCLQNHPQAVFSIGPPENLFEKLFGEEEAELVVELAQPEDEVLPSRETVDQVFESVLKQFPKSEVTGVAKQNIMVLKANQEQLLAYNVAMDGVYNGLHNALKSSEVGKLRNGQKNTPVVLSGRRNNIGEILNDLYVPSKSGVPVQVSSFLTVIEEETYKSVLGGKNGNYIPLKIRTDQPDAVLQHVKQEVNELNGLEVNFRGSYFSNKTLISEMAMVMGVAILLLYFVLAAQFESFIQPLIVLFELPISMSGALIMLFLFGSSINLISLIGLVVMCGIIINDSILKIDLVNQLRRKEGYSLMDALHTAGKRRLKSIIMTALTTILSVLPFLFGTDMGSLLQRPLSLALIGGMVIGTPVSLYFIPLVYWFYYRNERDFKRPRVEIASEVELSPALIE